MEEIVMSNLQTIAQRRLTLALNKLFDRLPLKDNPRMARTLATREIGARSPVLMEAVSSLDIGHMCVIAENLRGHQVLRELGLKLEFDIRQSAFILTPRSTIATLPSI